MDEKSKKVTREIMTFSAICAGVATQPLPGIDAIYLTAIQIIMGMRIAAIYGVPVTKSEMFDVFKELMGAIGLGFGAQQVAIGLYKIGLPGFGGIMTIPLVFGLTFAIGKIMQFYFKSKSMGKNLDKAEIKQIWKEELKKGKEEGKRRVKEILEKNKKIEIIKDEEHKKELSSAISHCTSCLLIESGWITDFVINDGFIKELEEAVNRNVEIYLGYGKVSSKGIHQERPENVKAEKKLLAFQSKYPRNVFVGKYSTHKKILIKDEDYYIITSCNWLSNNNFKNSESGRKIYDKEGLKAFFADTKIEILKNRISC